MTVVHLVPPERAKRRVIEGERVCKAIAAIGDQEEVADWADRFTVLGDPSRLALLLAIHRAGPISVSDLAVATNMNDTTASQALRYLRAAGVVVPQRDGRVVRYCLASPAIGRLLDLVTTKPSRQRRAAT